MPEMTEPLQALTDEEVRQALDPRHFVQIRTVIGGPNPQEVSRMMQLRTEESERVQEWLNRAGKRLQEADQLLEAAVRQRE